MQNDMLKNTIAPWQEKGRWYHGAWDCSTSSWLNDETDDFLANIAPSAVQNVYYIYLDLNTHVALDVKTSPRGRITISMASSADAYKYAVSGNVGIPIAPSIATSGIIDVYIFIKKL